MTRLPDALDYFDALPQNHDDGPPMTREQEEAAIDALLGISRDTGPLSADELITLMGDAA